MTPINSGHLIWWLRRELDATHDTYRFGFDWHEDSESVRAPGWGTTQCLIGGCDWESFGGTEPVAEQAWFDHSDAIHDAEHRLADVAAKRRVVGLCQAYLRQGGLGGPFALTVLREMATGLAGRDGFEEGWRTDG